MATTNSTASRRKYKRRSDDERIADLEHRIADLKARQAAKDRKDDPVMREIPKVQRRLRKFAQLAMNHNRPDIAQIAPFPRSERSPARLTPGTPLRTCEEML